MGEFPPLSLSVWTPYLENPTWASFSPSLSPALHSVLFLLDLLAHCCLFYSLSNSILFILFNNGICLRSSPCSLHYGPLQPRRPSPSPIHHLFLLLCLVASAESESAINGFSDGHKSSACVALLVLFLPAFSLRCHPAFCLQGLPT